MKISRRLLTRGLFPGSSFGPGNPLGPDPVGGRGTRHGGLGGAPVTMFASATVAAAAGRVNTGVLGLQNLGVGFRSGYYIDEIRVQAYVPSVDFNYGAGMAAVSLEGLGGCLRLKFTTGHHAFSQSAMPMSLYSPIWSGMESMQGIFNDSGTVIKLYAVAELRWLLPRPLYMPPGDVVQCSVEYDLATYVAPSALAKDVTVNATYVGRYVTPGAVGPLARQVPWVSWFESDAKTAWKHTASEWRNPLTRPLHLQRLTNRTYADVNTATTKTFAPTQTNAEGDGASIDTPWAGWFEAQLSDSLGYQIVPAFAPIGDVFNLTTGSWTFNRDLGPREQFNLAVRAQPAVLATANTNIFTQFGLIAYRDEEN